MMRVKVQTEQKHKFSIPVPYSFLNVFASIVSSKFLLRQVNKWIRNKSESSIFSSELIESKQVKYFLSIVIKELQQNKGLVIVDVKLQDGTQVLIKL